MKIPSPNTQAYQTYLAEMGAVFDSIKAMEDFGGEITFYFDPKSIPETMRAAQAADDAKLRDLGDNYTRLTDAFCAKYELTASERDYNFCNC